MRAAAAAAPPPPRRRRAAARRSTRAVRAELSEYPRPPTRPFALGPDDDGGRGDGGDSRIEQLLRSEGVGEVFTPSKSRSGDVEPGSASPPELAAAAQQFEQDAHGASPEPRGAADGGGAAGREQEEDEEVPPYALDDEAAVVSPLQQGRATASPAAPAPAGGSDFIYFDDLATFVNQPAAEGVRVECVITREKSRFGPSMYFLHLERMEEGQHKGVFLLAAKPRKLKRTSTTLHYFVSSNQGRTRCVMRL